MTATIPMFTLRDYDKRDFDLLFKLDRLCFDPGIAYSRPELASFIEQRRAYTVVAEWTQPAPETETESVLQSASGQTEADQPAEADSAEHELATHGSTEAGSTAASSTAASSTAAATSSRNQPRPPRRPIAGFVTFHYMRQGYGHVITIDVHPDARRHRLGTLLLNAVCERLRKMTAFMVVLEVAANNHSALAFYDKHGFKRVKVLERYYNRDVDGIFMTKRL